jgi:hypothetical protein
MQDCGLLHLRFFELRLQLRKIFDGEPLQQAAFAQS